MSTETKTSARHAMPKGFRWFAAGATTLAILLSIPATREIVRTEVYSLKAAALVPSLFLNGEQQQKATALRLRQEANRHPDDVAMQVSIASPPRPFSLTTSVDAATIQKDLSTANDLKQLSAKFPSSPLPAATLLHGLTQASIDAKREEENLLTPPDQRKETKVPANQKSLKSSAEALALYEEAAERGEKLDPTNAYFPAIHMISLIAAHRDDEAIAALARAARAPKWNEYMELNGRIRLAEAMNGTKMPAVAEASLFACELFPQYAQLRSVTRTLTALAMKKEQAGDTAGGFAIRHDLARLGARMRVDGQCAITSLVGIAITAISSSAPNGEYIPDAGKLSKEARAAQHLTDYVVYLNKNGYKDEAIWYAAETQAGTNAKAICRAGMEQSVYGNLMRLLCSAVGWSISGLILFSLFCTIMTGRVSAMILRQMSKDTRIPVCGWAVVAANALFLVGTSALLVYCGSRIFSPLAEINSLSNFYNEDNASNGSTSIVGILITSFLSGFAILFTGLAYAKKAKKEGQPATVGVLSRFRDDMLTNAGILLLLYSVATGFTGYLEHTLGHETEQMRQHEGRYLASLLHQEWPGDVKLNKDTK